jgi:hypothetical protein
MDNNEVLKSIVKAMQRRDFNRFCSLLSESMQNKKEFKKIQQVLVAECVYDYGQCKNSRYLDKLEDHILLVKINYSEIIRNWPDKNADNLLFVSIELRRRIRMCKHRAMNILDIVTKRKLPTDVLKHIYKFL